MCTTFRLVLAFTILCCVLIATLQADTLGYASAANLSSDTSTFGVLDLTTGAYTQIATVDVFVGDLAMAPDGTIYALTFPFTGVGSGEFATIDPSNGVITNIAADTAGLDTLGFSGNGTLYGIGLSTTGPDGLYSVNPSGVTSFITDLSGPAADDAIQLRFIGNTAYTTDYASPSSLYTINLTTGVTTLVGGTGLTASNELGSVVGGELVDDAASGSGGQLYFINPATGVVTVGPATSDLFVFTAAPTSVPEPGSALMTAFGLMALSCLGRRTRDSSGSTKQSFRLKLASSRW
jgi:hypothetical protein